MDTLDSVTGSAHEIKHSGGNEFLDMTDDAREQFEEARGHARFASLDGPFTSLDIGLARVRNPNT